MIEIVPYNPAWPAEFEQIAALVKAALGDLAVHIDHIGSTSVPGLAAKDIIDVQVTVRSFDAPLEESFTALGYTRRADINEDHQPPNWIGPAGQWQKRYFQPPPGSRPHHMHVRMAGYPNQRYALLFRDYLRTHPAAAAGYAALKRCLAAYHGDDREVYTLIKDPACDIILAAAEDWAEATGWDKFHI